MTHQIVLPGLWDISHNPLGYMRRGSRLAILYQVAATNGCSDSAARLTRRIYLLAQLNLQIRTKVYWCLVFVLRRLVPPASETRPSSEKKGRGCRRDGTSGKSATVLKISSTDDIGIAFVFVVKPNNESVCVCVCVVHLVRFKS